METLQAISKRHSTRDFKNDQIAGEDLDLILKAANCAPVGMGAYDSMHLTVIQNPELLAEIAGTSQGGPHSKGPFYGAPTVVLVSGKLNARFENIQFANAACIVENILIAAADLDIQSVYLWGFIPNLLTRPELLEKLALPDGFTPLSAAALGYAAEEEPYSHKGFGLTIIK
ncbi:MAG: nitroreductase [Actinobacteria bacterium]|nr:nitroreductase [Actinomycetota bacterium]